MDDKSECDESHNEDVDPMCHDEVSYEEESDSCIPQSQLDEMSFESGYSSESDGSNSVDMTSYELDATWEEKINT